MNRRSSYGIVDFNEGDNDNDNDDNEDSKSYSKHCEKFGFKVPLKNRIYPDNEPTPVDHDQWRQCHECGSIVPIYELEKEATIKDVVEIVDNPFDVSKNQFLGVDSRKARRKKRQKPNSDHISDPDVKRELASGQQLISYPESNV